MLHLSVPVYYVLFPTFFLPLSPQTNAGTQHIQFALSFLSSLLSPLVSRGAEKRGKCLGGEKEEEKDESFGDHLPKRKKAGHKTSRKIYYSRPFSEKGRQMEIALSFIYHRGNKNIPRKERTASLSCLASIICDIRRFDRPRPIMGHSTHIPP